MAFSPEGSAWPRAVRTAPCGCGIWPARRPSSPILRATQVGVWSVAFSPDGKSLAWGGEDGIVQLWDLGQPGKAVDLGLTQVVSCRWRSARGQEPGLGGWNKNILVWITPPEILARVCQTVWRNLTVDEWRRFVGPDIPYERTCPEPTTPSQLY